jgi:small subunit ribosomal protein S17
MATGQKIMPKRVMIGVVTSDKMAKTRRVEIGRLVRHPKYQKFVRRRTVCYVHDEDEQSGVGDTVEIVESRPLSKLKRWQLVRVVSKSSALDVAALRAARSLAGQTDTEATEVDESP